MIKKKELYQDNLTEVTLYLLQKRSIKVTDRSVRYMLKTHPDYPALSALADALSDWNVDHLSVRIKPEDIVKIELPALLHLTSGAKTDRFVVLEDISHQEARYYDSELGIVREPTSELIRISSRLSRTSSSTFDLPATALES